MFIEWSCPETLNGAFPIKEARKDCVKVGLSVTESVWVKRKCPDHATIDSNGNPHVLRKYWANTKSKPFRILVNLVMT